ncbi:hypothetical protein ACQ7HM_08125 [Williamsia sp. MIQD14]|uniref:hypothetical protein n=1 Tax=Williamsia sp. MIQD14 TaxID=3425703 RepID=UPI003DA088AF
MTRLTIDVDLDAVQGDVAGKVGRILRYWAGAVGQIPLDEPVAHELMDSHHRAVGTLRIE